MDAGGHKIDVMLDFDSTAELESLGDPSAPRGAPWR
jgi:hypothetical protein